MSKERSKAFISGCLLLLLWSCNTKEPLNTAQRFYRPEGFPPPYYVPVQNQYSEKQISLGKVLFFDPILSEDSTVSCRSCHNPQYAFSDYGHSFSNGIHNTTGIRNTPPIFNLAWNKTFMWDGGITHLEMMPIAPITNPAEMNLSIKEAVEKIQNSRKYQIAFFDAFGSSKINDYLLLKALAAFQSSLISADAPFDHMKQGTLVFSQIEQKGFELFNQFCQDCHTPPLFNSPLYASNGYRLGNNELGRYLVTQIKADSGKFKIPTLRNLNFTAPYMHDGSLKDLESVLDHYSTVSSKNTLGGPLIKRMKNFSKEEKTAIIAFLNTLNDENFINSSINLEK